MMDSSQATEQALTEQDFLPLLEKYRRMRKSMNIVRLGGIVLLSLNLATFILKDHAQLTRTLTPVFIWGLVVLLVAIMPACLKSVKLQWALKAQVRILSERHNVPFKTAWKQFSYCAIRHE